MQKIVGGMEARKDDKLVEVYRKIKENYFPDNEPRVLVPCCGTDKSPSEIFGNVTFLDKSESVVKTLKDDGLRAVVGDAERFDNGPYDLIILVGLNANGRTEKLKRGYETAIAEANKMEGGGLIVVDECNRAASRLLRYCNLTSVEAINKKDGEIYNPGFFSHMGENPFKLLNSNINNYGRNLDNDFEKRQDFVYLFRKWIPTILYK